MIRRSKEKSRHGAKMQRSMTTSFPRNFLLLAAILIASAVMIAAQSGRRGTKPPTSNTPTASESTTPEIKPQKSTRLQLLVGIEDPSPFDGISPYVADTVLATCVGRLNQSSGVNATVGSRKLTRGEAIKIAKAERQRYVVWLQVGNETADAGRRSRSADLIYIRYVVFEPGTAKVKRSGRVVRGIYTVGNVGGPGSTRRPTVYSDYAIKESAREAADKILEAFAIRIQYWLR